MLAGLHFVYTARLESHSLSLSVKAGGYGTGVRAIGGDVIIDLCKIMDVDIEPPTGSYTMLPAPTTKGRKSLPLPGA
jgi:hypothetical protein